MTQTRWNKLGISLGNKCNMMCDHCMPSSSIKDTSAISDAEVFRVVDFINRSEISEVSFTGGEPLVFYVDKIRAILAGLTHRPKIKITTNASFVKVNGNWKRLLQELAPDFIRVSYDQHHSKFLGIQYIQELIEECSEKQIDCLVEACISDPMDLVKLSTLPKDIKQRTQVNKVMRAGRALKTGCYFKSQVFDETGLTGKCPFVSQRDIMFWPGRGFSACCNNLSFSSGISPDEVFFENPDQVMLSRMWRELDSVSAMSDLVRRRPELANDPINSEPCNLCDSYFSKVGKEA